MNFFKKIGNLFSKMKSSQKNEKLVEALKETKPRPKEDPVQDIEDLIKTQYFSPLQTRNQRLKGSKIKAIPALATTSTSSSNTKLTPIPLLNSEISGNETGDLAKNRKALESIVPLAVELAAQPDALGLETVPNKNIIASELCHPLIAKKLSQPLEVKHKQELTENSTVNLEIVKHKNDAEVPRKEKAVKPKRKSKSSLNEQSIDLSENIASSTLNVKSSKAKNDRKVKQIAVSQDVEPSAEKKEPPPRKRTPKKESKEKKDPKSIESNQSSYAENVVAEGSAIQTKNTVQLKDFQFDPHKISTLPKVNEDTDQTKAESKKKKRASPSKSKELTDSEPEIKLEKWQPHQWQQTLENIKLMRSSQEAPVDTMGCHKCCDENADPKTKRFQNLVALMLSSQTRDQVTYEVMQRLRDNICTPASIASMDPKKLMDILQPVSFYKNKTKYLQNTAAILVERYDSDIPNNVSELIKLPGVGPKMAHICMSVAWNLVTGIGVDTHVHRISNRLGWVKNVTKDPEQTRKQLELWIPPKFWREVNYLLVGFGQTFCTPVRPKCDQCLNRAFCPSAFAAPSPSKRGIKQEKVEVS